MKPVHDNSSFPTAPNSASHERTPSTPIHPLFVERVSTRAFSSEPLSPTLVRALFEAARWSPSAANSQPWLFLVADHEPTLTQFRGLLNEQNRRWADNAPLLVFVLTQKHREGKVSRTAEFDAGAAWMSLALQATLVGLRARAMGGIRLDAVYDELRVPREDYQVLVAVAIGRPADATILPEDLRAREVPTQRKTLDQIVRRGAFDDVSPF
jgi:nitroreductase